jgi:hypothetical protein
VLKITGDATTQVITIDDGDGGAIALYPATIPHLASQLMAAAVALNLNLNYPVEGPEAAKPVTFQ